MPLEEKRQLYKPGDYIILDKVDPWCKFVIKNKDIEMLKHTLDDLTEFEKIKLDSSKDKELSEKVSIFQGDITKLEVNFHLLIYDSGNSIIYFNCMYVYNAYYHMNDHGYSYQQNTVKNAEEVQIHN